MADSIADPPESLASAHESFRKFLESNGYPSKIRWVTAEDVVPDGHRYWIRERSTDEGVIEANRRYATGMQRKLGIELRALCATNTETFATVFVPIDDNDAQYHLMGRCLKLSCPTTKYPASTVRNPIRWAVLEIWNRRKSTALRQSGEA